MKDRTIAPNRKDIQLQIRDPQYITDSELGRRTLILIRGHICQKSNGDTSGLCPNIFPLGI